MPPSPASTKSGINKTDGLMGFWEHVSALRGHILVSLIAFVAMSAACFGFSEKAAIYLSALLPDARFIFLSPPDLFMSYVGISATAGLGLSSPVILYQLWVFLKPALRKHERRSLALGLACATLFFAAGAAFAFFVVVPYSLRFFMQFGSEHISAMLSFRAYVGYVGATVLSFGSAFELPIAVLILRSFGIISTAALRKSRPFAILAIFIGAAIITPPDVVSQVVLAVPMLGLFELSVAFCTLSDRKSNSARISNAR